jgi:Domain of unknown function (DUF5615)
VLRLLSDENFNGRIHRALLRRIPELDLVRVQDVGLRSCDDPTVLSWAADADRILLTHDRETIPRFTLDRIESGMTTPGIFLVDDLMPIGQAVDELVLVIECSDPIEFANRITYFPL